MRRAPTLVMCAVTGLVLVGSIARSGRDGTSSSASAPVGVVTPGPSSPSARASASRAPRGPVSPSATTAARQHRSPSARPVTPSRAPSRSPSPAARKPSSVVVNGQAVDTRYGLVQVQVTISGHRIVKADAIDYPQGSSRDREINDYAVPQLDDETLQAQSAQIDTVSGATYTSEGYRSSLQSALDNAHAAGVW